MPANTDPIYTRTPDVQVGGAVLGPSANTATDGTGANTTVIFTSDGTEGGFVQKVILKAVGSPAATVARIFLCTATGTITPGTTNTAANTALIAEVALAAWTASNTQPSNQYEIPLNLPLPADHKLMITFGTSTGASGTGYAVTTVGGKY
jgi:hypothetical protein